MKVLITALWVFYYYWLLGSVASDQVSWGKLRGDWKRQKLESINQFSIIHFIRNTVIHYAYSDCTIVMHFTDKYKHKKRLLHVFLVSFFKIEFLTRYIGKFLVQLFTFRQYTQNGNLFTLICHKKCLLKFITRKSIVLMSVLNVC